MKKLIFYLFVMIFIFNTVNAIDLDFGFSVGKRQFKDSKIKDTYGNSTIYKPFVNVRILKWLGVSASFETGYKGEGSVGLFEEQSSLKLNGFNFSVMVNYRIKLVEPFLKIGFASYSYKQDIDSQHVLYKVDHSKGTTTFGAGINIFLFKGFFISAGIEQIPLKVKPFEKEVDLSGMLILIGIGYQLNL